MIPGIDEVIKQDVIDQLIWDDRINANEIAVKVQEGVVKLEGTVPSYAVKKVAEEDASNINGVIKITNSLKVTNPDNTGNISDTAIKENVQSRLLWDTRLNSSAITVEVLDKVVILLGSVYSYWEKTLAEDIAVTSVGVLWVDNKLSVKLKKTKLDLDIEKDLKNALKRNLLSDLEKLQVDVSDGVARIRGSVPAKSIKKEIGNVAMHTSGINDIINEVTVE
ncbi:MAG: BON domain-containing protein [Bacteroidales bacterium]